MTVTEAKKNWKPARADFSRTWTFDRSVNQGLMVSTGEGFFNAFLWFMDIDYWVSILIGIIIMLACRHFYGQLAGKLILIKNGITYGPAF